MLVVMVQLFWDPINKNSYFCIVSQLTFVTVPATSARSWGEASHTSPVLSVQHTFPPAPRKPTAGNFQENTCTAVRAQSRDSAEAFKCTFYWKTSSPPPPSMPSSHTSWVMSCQDPLLVSAVQLCAVLFPSPSSPAYFLVIRMQESVCLCLHFVLSGGFMKSL